MDKQELVKSLCDRPIAFNPAFVPIAGICGALMLSQAIYWSRRTRDPDGWFYKTQKAWQAETGMNRTEQEKARRALKSAGVLEEDLRGVPAKLHYKVDFDKLYAAVMDDSGGDDLAPSSLRESDKLDCAEPANKLAGKTQTITESTTETTPESSGPNGPGADTPSNDQFGVESKPPSLKNGENSEDTRSLVWRTGVEILTRQGMAEPVARRMIGKWAKQGEKKLAGLIGQCAVKPPADAKAYIQAAIQTNWNLYDERQLEAAGKAHGVEARPGESWQSFRERVSEVIRGKAAG